MNYIPRVDEVLLGPPFWLGLPGTGSRTSTPAYKFRSHVFMLETDRSKLQKLIDEQLNAAFPNGPVKYVVPEALKYVWLAFLRYERAEAMNFAAEGWLAYTETLIGFLVRREVRGQPFEFVSYLGVVYIDDSKYTGQVEDPSSVPIVLGREAYGLPKNPGQIFYDPHPAAPEFPRVPRSGKPECPKLEVWDINTPSKLALALAIEICPEPQPTLVALRQWFARFRRRRPARGREEEEAPRLRDFSFIARQFGLAPTDLRLEPAALEHAFLISLPRRLEQPPAIAYDNLQWRTKLVGLKQFPDPKSSTGGACYQVAVESPLEEVNVPFPKSILGKQVVKFPVVKRVDLIDSFGIVPTPTLPPRQVLVPTDRMYYQDGVLIYAKPGDVNVFVPT